MFSLPVKLWQKLGFIPWTVGFLCSNNLQNMLFMTCAHKYVTVADLLLRSLSFSHRNNLP